MARRGDRQDAGERKACQGWLYRYRLTRHAHGGTAALEKNRGLTREIQRLD